MKFRLTGFLTIEGPYSRSQLPDIAGNVRRNGRNKRCSITQHQTLDQEAERTRIQAGSDAVVLGQNVGSIGAQVSGKALTQIEGADQTLLYDVQEVHQYTANSQTRKGFIGITYSKSSSQDSSLQSNALPTELKSDQAVRVGVGAVTDVRGAVLTAPQIEFYRSANADTTKPGELILGASTNTTETSHTEKTTTAGVWQAQSGQGQTSQTANQTQINGQLVIGQGIHTTVQIPEGALKDQIMQLASQPGQGYMAELASNPKVNWAQIKLVHDHHDSGHGDYGGGEHHHGGRHNAGHHHGGHSHNGGDGHLLGSRCCAERGLQRSGLQCGGEFCEQRGGLGPNAQGPGQQRQRQERAAEHGDGGGAAKPE